MNVASVRMLLASNLGHGVFVGDKTGSRLVELVGASFRADEDSIVGTVNGDWCERELKWYLSESLNVNDIPPPVPAIWRQVADPDGFINSNYGWCMFSRENGSQMSRVVNELAANRESRRAVAIYTRPSMWDDYNRNGRSDFICTNAVQYLIRDGLLEVVVQMRSNDAVFGYKGDLYWQRFVQSLVAAGLGVRPGRITWQAGSLHVYERHFYLLDHWSRTGVTTIAKERYRELYPESEWAA